MLGVMDMMLYVCYTTFYYIYPSICTKPDAFCIVLSEDLHLETHLPKSRVSDPHFSAEWTEKTRCDQMTFIVRMMLFDLLRMV